MLCISVIEDNKNLYARFETHTYFEETNSFRRSLLGVQDLNTHNPQDLLRDSNFYDATVMWLGVVISSCVKNNKINYYKNNVLYPHIYKGKKVLRMDDCYAKDFQQKEFCCDLLLPDKSVITEEIQTEEYQSKLARIICKFLPLN